MIKFLASTAVAAIGSTPLTRPSTGGEALVLNVYNASASTRTVTVSITNGATVTFSFAVAAGTPASVLLTNEGNLSVSADGTGVSGWLAKSS